MTTRHHPAPSTDLRTLAPAARPATAPRPAMASPLARLGALALSALVTVTVLGSLGGIADLRYTDAMLAQSHSTATQVATPKALPAPRG